VRKRRGSAAISVSRSALRRTIAEDFSRGDTVRVRGWVLSRVECRVYVLACYESNGGERPLV
jgi:hypothetical protein